MGYTNKEVGLFADLLFAWHAGITFCSSVEEFTRTNLRDVVNVMGVTHLYSTSTLISGLNPEHVPSIQHLFVSGETLGAKVHRTWAGKGLCSGMQRLSPANKITFEYRLLTISVNNRLQR